MFLFFFFFSTFKGNAPRLLLDKVTPSQVWLLVHTSISHFSPSPAWAPSPHRGDRSPLSRRTQSAFSGTKSTVSENRDQGNIWWRICAYLTANTKYTPPPPVFGYLWPGTSAVVMKGRDITCNILSGATGGISYNGVIEEHSCLYCEN